MWKHFKRMIVTADGFPHPLWFHFNELHLTQEMNYNFLVATLKRQPEEISVQSEQRLFDFFVLM